MLQVWPFLILTILLSSSYTIQTSLADYAPYHQSSAHDSGLLGDWPTETYRSSPLLGPAINYIQSSPLCNRKIGGGSNEELYTLLAPRGSAVRTPGPMIVDSEGHLVWTKMYGQTHMFGVYQFKEREYLAFGVENDGIRGFGDGVYYMLDSSYEEVYTIKGANGLPVDLREFHITRDETAVITAYEIKAVDLRAIGGPKDGRIYDSIVQEIDIESGKLLFQWRASEHVDFTQVPYTRVESHEQAWNFFDINSVEKDGRGNFLVSSASINSLSYISGTMGKIIWNLGGANNSFEDLSNGAATNFNGQHHARFQENNKSNNTAITLFDNNPAGSTSRGLYLDLDLNPNPEQKKTAHLRHEYIYTPTNIHSPSAGGSLQTLANGNLVQSYGINPIWTEFSDQGDVLCHVHFGAASAFGQGRVFSERVLKGPWTGTPKTSPDIALYGYEAAVSWNGATEVVTWVLQGANDPEQDKKQSAHNRDNNHIPNDDGNDNNDYEENIDIDYGFTFLTAFPKTSFETILPIPPHTTPKTITHLRILALNHHGHLLGTTKLTKWDPDADQPILGLGGPASSGPDLRPLLWFVVGFVVAAVVGVVVWVVRRRIAARKVLGRRGRRRMVFGGDGDSSEGEEGWDEEGDDGELSDEELIDAVEFSLLGGRALRDRGIRGIDSDDDDDDDIDIKGKAPA